MSKLSPRHTTYFCHVRQVSLRIVRHNTGSSKEGWHSLRLHTCSLGEGAMGRPSSVPSEVCPLPLHLGVSTAKLATVTKGKLISCLLIICSFIADSSVIHINLWASPQLGSTVRVSSQEVIRVGQTKSTRFWSDTSRRWRIWGLPGLVKQLSSNTCAKLPLSSPWPCDDLTKCFTKLRKHCFPHCEWQKTTPSGAFVRAKSGWQRTSHYGLSCPLGSRHRSKSRQQGRWVGKGGYLY